MLIIENAACPAREARVYGEVLSYANTALQGLRLGWA